MIIQKNVNTDCSTLIIYIYREMSGCGTVKITLFVVRFLQPANSIFLSHSSSTSLQPPASQPYFSLTPFQH